MSDKPRLSDAQKKQNHIDSEKKRREAIRRGFYRLSEIVPGMAGLARSEAVVLQATVDYLRDQLARKDKLREEALARGMTEEEFEQAYRGAEDATNEADDNGGSPSSGNASTGHGRRNKNAPAGGGKDGGSQNVS